MEPKKDKSTNGRLFSIISNDLDRYIDILNAKKRQGHLNFPFSYLDNIARALFPNIEKSGYCTLPIPGKPYWNPKSEYYEAQRNAARRGIKIERAYLFPLKNLLNDSIVQKHIQLDLEANIDVHLLYIGECLKKNLFPFIDTLEFGLWDNQLTFSPILSAEDQDKMEIMLSSKQEDIEYMKNKWHIIFKNSKDLNSISKIEADVDLEEPMLTTAPVTDFLAKVICKGGQVDEDDCYWYHSVWQYLRILDLVSTPTWHSNFYKKQLKRLVETRKPISILISGTADYSVLAHVIWAFRDYSDEDLNITVLDLCETPLFLCRWYAKLVDRNIVTIANNIFTYEPSFNFDAIVTDAFLTRFPLESRKKVLSKWYSLLKKDGKLITTVRLGGRISGVPRKGSEKKANQFEIEIKNVGRYWRDFLPIQIELLSKRGREYALKMTSYSAGTHKEIIELFQEHNFKVVYEEENEVKGELEPTKYLDLSLKKT